VTLMESRVGIVVEWFTKRSEYQQTYLRYSLSGTASCVTSAKDSSFYIGGPLDLNDRHLLETRDLPADALLPTDLDHGGINLSIRRGFGLPVQT
jgi:hypothetical protein